MTGDKDSDELMDLLNAMVDGLVEFNEDGGYDTVFSYDEEVEFEVEKEYIAKTQEVTISPEGKMLMEIADWKEDRTDPGMKFIPNMADYRAVNFSRPEEVFKDFELICDTPMNDRLSNCVGGIVYNKKTSNKQTKGIQSVLVQLITSQRGNKIAIVGQFGSLSYALSCMTDSQRYYFYGLSDETLEKLRQYSKYDDFYAHYNPDNGDYDVVIKLQDLDMRLKTKKTIRVQFCGDDDLYYGKGSAFFIRGISTPSCDGTEFYNVEYSYPIRSLYSKYVYVTMDEMKYSPIVEPRDIVSSEKYALATKEVFRPTSHKVVGKKIVGSAKTYDVSDGWYMTEESDQGIIIVMPLNTSYFHEFYNRKKLDTDKGAIKDWHVKLKTPGLGMYIMKLNSISGLMVSGIEHYSVCQASHYHLFPLYVRPSSPNYYMLNQTKIDVILEPNTNKYITQELKRFSDMMVPDKGHQTFNVSDKVVQFGVFKSPSYVYQYMHRGQQLYVFSPDVAKSQYFVYNKVKYKIHYREGFLCHCVLDV